MQIRANNPYRQTWLPVPAHSDFPLQNLPFGAFITELQPVPHLATRIGDTVVDLAVLAQNGYFDDLPLLSEYLQQTTLNALLRSNKQVWRWLRDRLSDLLSTESDELRLNATVCKQALLSILDVRMQMPVHIGDYTDFYSSKEHATNVGIMFRGVDNALMPNWLHLPVAYHGRSSSITISGTSVRRPKGQTNPTDAPLPSFGASKMLDFELEVGFITGQGKPLGESISTIEAEDYIFGLVLFNDWSARDIQKWEYQPLGPFLAKNFASSISPWIVTLDALAPFRTAAPTQHPDVLPYLQYHGDKGIDLNLEVWLQPAEGEAVAICRSNHKYLYWTIVQQLAHHTINGCNINAGDMLASGTISGATPDSFGSMLELTWRGTKPIILPDGSERKFIQDGDTVILRGFAERNGVRIGLGEVSNTILPTL